MNQVELERRLRDIEARLAKLESRPITEARARLSPADPRVEPDDDPALEQLRSESESALDLALRAGETAGRAVTGASQALAAIELRRRKSSQSFRAVRDDKG